MDLDPCLHQVEVLEQACLCRCLKKYLVMNTSDGVFDDLLELQQTITEAFSVF
jgi:hypothetical protein